MHLICCVLIFSLQSGVTHLQNSTAMNHIHINRFGRSKNEKIHRICTKWLMVLLYAIVVSSLFTIIITHNFRGTSLKLSSITHQCSRQLYNGIFVLRRFFFRVFRCRCHRCCRRRLRLFVSLGEYPHINGSSTQLVLYHTLFVSFVVCCVCFFSLLVLFSQ